MKQKQSTAINDPLLSIQVPGPGPLSLVLSLSSMAVALLLLALMVGGCEPKRFEPPKPPPEDPKLPPVRLNLPAPPRILKPSTPEAYPDGVLSIYGLRRFPERYLKKEVRVRGFVQGVYECPWAEFHEKARKASERARRLGRPAPKPEQSYPPCKQPHLFMTDTPRSRRKLLVVGYDPEETKEPEVGQRILLTGTFANDSLEGFISPEGLLRLTAWEEDKVGD